MPYPLKWNLIQVDFVELNFDLLRAPGTGEDKKPFAGVLGRKALGFSTR